MIMHHFNLPTSLTYLLTYLPTYLPTYLGSLGLGRYLVLDTYLCITYLFLYLLKYLFIFLLMKIKINLSHQISILHHVLKLRPSKHLNWMPQIISNCTKKIFKKLKVGTCASISLVLIGDQNNCILITCDNMYTMKSNDQLLYC